MSDAQLTETDLASSEGSESVRPVVTASRHSPLRKTIGDIVRSMALVGAVVAGLLLVTWRPPPDPIREVDPYPVAAGAAEQLQGEILLPPPTIGWRATSARVTPSAESADEPVWFNGWVSPDEEYFAVIQSVAAHSDFIAEQTDDGAPLTLSGDYPWPGQEGQPNSWVAYSSEDGTNKSFVRFVNGQTTIVTSSAGWSELATFADRLVPAKSIGG